MSWPDDGQPRFVVTSVTGRALNVNESTSSSRPGPMPVSFQVIDRAYCHQLVREFAPSNGRFRGAPHATERRRQADLLAADLNAEDAAA